VAKNNEDFMVYGLSAWEWLFSKSAQIKTKLVAIDFLPPNRMQHKLYTIIIWLLSEISMKIYWDVTNCIERA